MKTKPSNKQPACQDQPAACPQLAVRSDVRAGLSNDCELGVGYWRKELNSLKQISSALNCS